MSKGVASVSGLSIGDGPLPWWREYLFFIAKVFCMIVLTVLLLRNAYFPRTPTSALQSGNLKQKQKPESAPHLAVDSSRTDTPADPPTTFYYHLPISSQRRRQYLPGQDASRRMPDCKELLVRKLYTFPRMIAWETHPRPTQSLGPTLNG